MHISNLALLAFTLFVVQIAATSAHAQGNPEDGKKAFIKCVICHSKEPNVHKTGPSLANILGAKAGTAEGFSRYSKALKASGTTWNDETLDAWLRDPRSLIPGTLMNMRGIKNATERRDIVAYLKQLASGDGPKSAEDKDSGRGGRMMGKMGSSEPTDISNPSPAQRVVSLRYCRDTYQLTTADGKTSKFWEFNLRFKTDSSPKGPPKDQPVKIPAGMMGGDRSFVVFHRPREIGSFIEEKC